ncbi:MAG: DUF1810 family protein [Antarcticimicrobium sp.]|uniref:DUF1810 domain-containing protein n=1 Tax=Antarcticimicrobium sp. TaxID=2824147 RepID=UPI00261DA3A1|nr:DUF1810 family protein [Antarcticimicrobium sp.]MDF1715777.1 DUF1810 family protein [Antarcticimicrobium sp.]
MPDLSRFHQAQSTTYDTALAELAAGAKAAHWMWFVFPQLRGLGRSATAQYYGLADLAEARAFLADPVLGPRLTACARALLGHAGTAPEAILGPVDAMKLRSSATLFEAADGGPEFAALLETFHGGRRCARTQELLRAAQGPPRRGAGRGGMRV